MSALMPSWGDDDYWARRPGVQHIRRALAARGYTTPEPFYRDALRFEGRDPDHPDEYLWSWFVAAYAPDGSLTVIRADSVREALERIAELAVQP